MENKKLIAYAWASGLIEFGHKVPEGALPIVTGDPETVRDVVTTVCRHGYRENEYLVPGVPEAGLGSEEAVDALATFRERVETHLELLV